MKQIIIALLLITNFSFSQEWTKITLNDFSSIEFPLVPDKQEINGDTYFSATDSLGMYLVVIKNISAHNIKSSQLKQYYKGVMSGALDSANGELLKQNPFQLNTLIGEEMVYIANSNPQLPDLRHKRILINNNNLISYEFWTYDNLKQQAAANKERFFNSINIVVTKEIKSTPKETSSAFKAAYIFGKLAVFIGIAALIIGGVLIVRKKRRRRNK